MPQTQQEYEAAVAAFIRAKGVTRCPTACAVPTHASVAEADRRALEQRAAAQEVRRAARKEREAALYRFGRAA